jgi:hypothetical protein
MKRNTADGLFAKSSLLAGTWKIYSGATAGGAIFLAHLGTGINPAPGTAHIYPGENPGNLR